MRYFSLSISAHHPLTCRSTSLACLPASFYLLTLSVTAWSTSGAWILVGAFSDTHDFSSEQRNPLNSCGASQAVSTIWYSASVCRYRISSIFSIKSCWRRLFTSTRWYADSRSLCVWMLFLIRHLDAANLFLLRDTWRASCQDWLHVKDQRSILVLAA